MTKRTKYKFEYKKIDHILFEQTLAEVLNEHGKDGWEYKKTIAGLTDMNYILLVRRYEMIDDGDVDVDE